MTSERGESRGGWLSRREFHRLALAGAVTAVSPSVCAGSTNPQASPVGGPSRPEGKSSAVVVTGVPRGAGPAATIDGVRRAALAATDFSWLRRGDTVLIKPVCNSGNVYPATTDPLALQSMIALLREKGARRVIVADMSGVQFVRFSADRLSGSTRALMTRNGMARACEAAGAEVHAFEEAGWDGFYDETPRRGDNWRHPLLLPTILKGVDHIVLMPRCSRHLLAGSTLGLKAAVGWWRHDSRLEYHHDARTFTEKTAESNTAPTLLAKQRLVLTSATRVLTTFGPDDGHVHEPETGIVVASTSVVAHDMVALAWLMEARRQIPVGVKDGIMEDPYQSATAVNLANRFVTGMLGGFTRALSAETLERRDIDTVWDDRVLAHAFAIFDGVPQVEIVDPDGSVPPALVGALSAAVKLPA